MLVKVTQFSVFFLQSNFNKSSPSVRPSVTKQKSFTTVRLTDVLGFLIVHLTKHHALWVAYNCVGTPRKLDFKNTHILTIF